MRPYIVLAMCAAIIAGIMCGYAAYTAWCDEPEQHVAVGRLFGAIISDHLMEGAWHE